MAALVTGLVEVLKDSVPAQLVGPHQFVQVPGEPDKSGAVRICKYTAEVSGVSAVHWMAVNLLAAFLVLYGEEVRVPLYVPTFTSCKVGPSRSSTEERSAWYWM